MQFAKNNSLAQLWARFAKKMLLPLIQSGTGESLHRLQIVGLTLRGELSNTSFKDVSLEERALKRKQTDQKEILELEQVFWEKGQEKIVMNHTFFVLRDKCRYTFTDPISHLEPFLKTGQLDLTPHEMHDFLASIDCHEGLFFDPMGPHLLGKNASFVPLEMIIIYFLNQAQIYASSKGAFLKSIDLFFHQRVLLNQQVAAFFKDDGDRYLGKMENEAKVPILTSVIQV